MTKDNKYKISLICFARIEFSNANSEMRDAMRSLFGVQHINDICLIWIC